MVAATASFLFSSCFYPFSLLGQVGNLQFFLKQLHFARHYNLILIDAAFEVSSVRKSTALPDTQDPEFMLFFLLIMAMLIKMC